MAKARTIRRRTKAVENVRLVTRTMEMVSSARFKRVVDRAAAARPYTERAAPDQLTHPLLLENPVLRRDVLLVITTNRGLCGTLNGSVLRLATERRDQLRAGEYEVLLRVAGKKGMRHCRFHGIEVEHEYADLGDVPDYDRVLALTDSLMGNFLADEISGVEVAYMQFLSPGRQAPVIAQILPLSNLEAPPRSALATGEPAPYDLQPSSGEILAELLPATVRLRMYQCFLDSSLSEQIVRARAMQSASDSAEEMLSRLTVQYNRLRQKQITTELMEIMGGSAGRGRPVAEPGAAERVRRLLENPEGKVEVTVTSAVALSAAQRRQVRKMLRTVVAGEPVVTVRVDPQVLGGLVLQVGDRVYDASVAGKLGTLVSRLAPPSARAT